MVSGEAPAVARRRLRLALRNAREARGLSRLQVAESLDWSLSKVQRMESGDVTVSSSDLKAAMALFGVHDPLRLKQLLEDARASRRKGWWDEPRYRQHLTEATTQLVQFETVATAIRVYHPLLAPGLLQTPAYAGSVLESWIETLSRETCAARFESRMRRRDRFLARPDPPRYEVVLDESALHRNVGGPQVMHEQMCELLALIRRQRALVRVVAFDNAAPIGIANAFSLIDVGDEQEDAILYQEVQLDDRIEQSKDTIELYRRQFDQLWRVALSEQATIRLIEARAAAVLPASGPVDLRA